MTPETVDILIVDDMPEKLLVLESVLKEPGLNLVFARSGAEALRKVLAHEFAVILLDVNMPDVDGFETAALIRKRKKSAHTPIIFITAFADELHTAQAYSLGAVDYILSPVVPDVLRTKVRVFADLFRMTAAVKRQADERIALAQEQAARAAAEELTRRSTFLAEASRVLSSSLDPEATVRNLLHATVPHLGDWSALTRVDEHKQLRQTEVEWIDPFHRRGNATLGTERLPSVWVAALLRTLESGTMERLEELEPELPRLPHHAANGKSGSVPEDEEPGEAVFLPLTARNRILGVFTVGMRHSHRRLTPSDVALAEDLAGRAAIALDNAQLYHEVQKADQHKNDFLSMLAHELRNPLAPIRNAVQILRLRGGDEPVLQTVRDLIDRQVQQLVRIVDDLLDISRITRGKIRLQMEPVELANVIARAVETSRPLIDARRHQLSLSVPAEPIKVQADPVRLTQVVGNLLNNAAKYTEEGGQIDLQVERNCREAVIRVRDTGIGIPGDMLSSVFDLFTQAERSLDRSEGGLGIGLTLVRRLVEMHAGRVEAFSPGPNQGSEFVVHLPLLEEAAAPCGPINGAVPAPARGRQCRVLVVDDNVDAAESIAMLLRMAGHNVRAVYDGPEALNAAATFQPELILLDIGLPGMDGYEVARQLRSRTASRDTMLVAVTGYGQDEDFRRSREAGFDHHLVKPADPATLLSLFAHLGSR